MTLVNLYRTAEQNNIEVYSYDLNKCESLSVLVDGTCAVAINPFALKSESDEKVKLAHELGHCETGAFYNCFSALDIRSKHEYTANKWAIKKLVPEDELKQAIKNGCENRWQLSEYFGVTEDFMQKALDYYRERGILYEICY